METELRLLESPIESVKWHVDFSDDESYLDYRRKLVKTQPGFYRNLEPIKLGFDIVELLRKIGFELVVLTKASEKYPETWGEKVEWAQRYLPDASITITQKKGLVYGRVLVDDWPEYYNAWLAHRPNGLVIAVAHDYNVLDNDDKKIIRYDGTNLDQVKEALVKAYER